METRYFDQFNSKEKKYYQIITENLLNEHPVKTNPHYLFMLGTGVDYVGKPQSPTMTDKYGKQVPNPDTCYLQGELLSYTAQVTSTLVDLNEVPAINPDASHKSYSADHAYHSSSVDIISGADNPGQAVGYRIAKALVILVGEIAKGKTSFNVTGFSRGSVESIVLMHELQRLIEDLEKDALEPDSKKRKSLGEIIVDSHSVPSKIGNTTRAALEILVDSTKNQNDDFLKKSLLNKLKSIKVNLFVLDPVPGSDTGIVGLAINWNEPCFYQKLPAFVKKQILFLQKNETSWYFTPILLKGIPYEILPGHHGAGDGNLRDHNGKDLPQGSVAPVLYMVLRRWLNFMFKDHVITNDIALKHDELDLITNEFLKESDLEKRHTNYLVSLLKNYKLILVETIKACKHLDKSSYPFGRREIRLVNDGENSYRAVTTLDTHGDGKNFLNRKHAQVWVKSNIKKKFEFHKGLTSQIAWLNTEINNVFTNINKDLGDSRTDAPLNKLIETEQPDCKNEAAHALSILINSVAQSYLRNNLSDNDKNKCRAYVEQTITLLVDSKKNKDIPPQYKDFADSLLTVFRSDLTRLLIEHQNSLLAMASQQFKEQASLINLTNIIPAYTDAQINEINKIDLSETIDEHDKSNQIDEIKWINEIEGTSKIERFMQIRQDIKEREELKNYQSQWLSATEKLYSDLDSLTQHIAKLSRWCIKEELNDQWREILQLPSHIKASSDTLIESMQKRIHKERKKLIDTAVELNASMTINFNCDLNKESKFYKDILNRIEFEKSDEIISKLNNEKVLVEKEYGHLEKEHNHLVNKHGELLELWKNSKEKCQMLSDINYQLSNQLNEKNNENKILNNTNDQLCNQLSIANNKIKKYQDSLERQEKASLERQKKKQLGLIEKIKIEEKKCEEQKLAAEKISLGQQEIMGIVIGKFLNFSTVYITKNTESNQGMGYFFSSHGKNGRKIALDFVSLFFSKYQDMQSIVDVKNMLWQLIDENKDKLSGGYNEGSFKTYLYAYAMYLDTLPANNFNNVRIDDFDIDVNVFMTNFINRVKTEKIDIKTSFNETFKPTINNII